MSFLQFVVPNLQVTDGDIVQAREEVVKEQLLASESAQVQVSSEPMAPQVHESSQSMNDRSDETGISN